MRCLRAFAAAATAYRGISTHDVGSWNSAYHAVYQLSFALGGTGLG